jgi:hypothetical protein
MAGDLGLEPKLAESKSAVLTITLIPDGREGRTRTYNILVNSQAFYH